MAGRAGLRASCDSLSRGGEFLPQLLRALVPSVFDMAATEDFLNSIRSDMRGRRGSLGIVAMRVDPRTKAAAMLEEYLRHFDIPILAYLRSTQNYVNAAAAGLTIFDPPRTRNRRDVEQWDGLLSWLEGGETVR